jgi:hypothetical protein
VKSHDPVREVASKASPHGIFSKSLQESGGTLEKLTHFPTFGEPFWYDTEPLIYKISLMLKSPVKSGRVSPN